MFYWFLAIASVLGFLSLIRYLDKGIRAREKTIYYNAQKAAAKAALEEKEQEEKAKALADITLSFDKSKLFNSKEAPLVPKDQATYTEIIDGYLEWYKEHGYGNQLWFTKALKNLRSQNGYIDFVYQDIQHVIEMLDSKGLHETARPCVKRIQSVLDTYIANREESLRLMSQIHFNSEDDILVERLKKVLLCLIGDNDKLIEGLNTFNASVHKVLAEICQDDTTDHVTDFTSLNELLQIPERIEKVMEESRKRITEAKTVKEASVPTLEMPANNHHSALSYFETLGLDQPRTTTPVSAIERYYSATGNNAQ